MLPRKPVNKEINSFYGVQFSVSLVSLNDCRSQNSDRIKKLVPYSKCVRTIKSPYHIVCTSFMPLNRNKDKEHSRFIFAATLSALRR